MLRDYGLSRETRFSDAAPMTELQIETERARLQQLLKDWPLSQIGNFDETGKCFT